VRSLLAGTDQDRPMTSYLPQPIGSSGRTARVNAAGAAGEVRIYPPQLGPREAVRGGQEQFRPLKVEGRGGAGSQWTNTREKAPYRSIAARDANRACL
jgi:hypothetical protein